MVIKFWFYAVKDGSWQLAALIIDEQFWVSAEMKVDVSFLY